MSIETFSQITQTFDLNENCSKSKYIFYYRYVFWLALTNQYSLTIIDYLF